MACRLFGKPLSKLMLGIFNRTIRNKFSDFFLIKIQNFLFTKMHLKLSSTKLQPFYPGGDEVNRAKLRRYYTCMVKWYKGDIWKIAINSHLWLFCWVRYCRFMRTGLMNRCMKYLDIWRLFNGDSSQALRWHCYRPVKRILRLHAASFLAAAKFL